MSEKPPKPQKTQGEIIKAFMDAIDRGDYKYGQQLESARKLAEQYEATHQTMSVALTVMAGMGMVALQRGIGPKVIASKPGRITLGTYRSANREVPTGTTAWARDNGDGSKEGPTTVTHMVTTEADADTGIPVGAEVVERSRTRFDPKGAPAQHKRTLVAADAAALTPEGWTGLPPMLRPGDVIPPAGMSISKWLGMGVVRVSYEICTAPASGPAAQALTLPEGTPCLRIVSQGVRADGTVAFATVTTAPMRSSISLEINEENAE
jgi:GntR family transcriptional regulator